MRTIKKINTGNIHSLITAQINNGIPTDSAHATRAWGNFKDHNQLLFQKLLIEQFGLCCYTELNLADLKAEHGIGSHLEHEQPKNMYPQRTFDEANLLSCALDSDDLVSYKNEQRFGGHYKDNNPHNQYDANRFISPQSSNCRDYFVYIIIDGTIAPKAGLSPVELDKATYTIAHLNLNSPFLKAERERWLTEIDNVLKPLISSNDISAIENIAQCELTLTSRGHPTLHRAAFDQLRPFHSATRNLFGAIGQRVITQFSPHID